MRLLETTAIVTGTVPAPPDWEPPHLEQKQPTGEGFKIGDWVPLLSLPFWGGE